MAEIKSFSGEYRFLSNFYHSPIEYEGISYPTVEHAYQAAKTTDITAKKHIANCDTPGDAKRAGRKLLLRNNWDEVRLGCMLFLLIEKFYRHADLRQRLLATGNAHLEEGNTWGDRFWGTCNGVGDNWLGIQLMGVRAAFREEAEPKSYFEIFLNGLSRG